jgi:hypothetical protein
MVEGYRSEHEIEAEAKRQANARAEANRRAAEAARKEFAKAVARLRTSGRPPDCMIELRKWRFLSAKREWGPAVPGWYLGRVVIGRRSSQSARLHDYGHFAIGSDGCLYSDIGVPAFQEGVGSRKEFKATRYDLRLLDRVGWAAAFCRLLEEAA